MSVSGTKVRLMGSEREGEIAAWGIDVKADQA